ncbi:MAG: 4-(cytidine 5'-diphospho)-2-C-methyl-D-erythritol kinase [Gammaproteobacteria bacterium]
MENHHVTSRDWPAPAKLNLFLHVVGRRPDGYHLLQTVFQFIDYCDLIDFSVRADGKLVRQANYTDIPADADLVMRAAAVLKTEAGCRLGAAIAVNKRLPVGGGLGGGSSDAATTLVALNRLWELNLSREDLAGIGLRVGADVPVFVRGHAAWAEGVGEKLTPVTPEECWYLVIHPGIHVPTAEIFGAADLTRTTPATTIRDFLEAGGHNDCEPVVRRRYPAVAEALDWLGGFGKTQMTGTGSCIFAAFGSREQAHQIYTGMPDKWRGFIARGLNRSPLLERLAQEKN